MKRPVGKLEEMYGKIEEILVEYADYVPFENQEIEVFGNIIDSFADYCTGKFFYDLAENISERKAHATAVFDLLEEESREF